MKHPAHLIADYLEWASKPNFGPTVAPLVVYRGQTRQFPLLPKMCRLPGSRIQNKFSAIKDKDGNEKWSGLQLREDEIIEEYRTRFGLENWRKLDVLAYAQHHGAPTRLLDWTKNPLVALWFAIEGSGNDNEFSGAVYQLSAGTPGTNTFPASIGESNFDLPNLKNFPIPSAIVFLSPLKVERSDRQKSVFSISSFEGEALFQPIDEFAKKGVRIFEIPKEQKIKLREFLIGINLDAYSIYGGADSLGKSLSLMYEIQDSRLSETDLAGKRK